MNPSDDDRRLADPAEPSQAGTDAPAPVLPAHPPRITIQTSPPVPNAASPQAGGWSQAQPYGASPHAMYADLAPQRGARLKRLLVPVLVLALVGSGAVVLLRHRLFRNDEPAYPKEWDPRVAELADFVSSERDLDWVHPVFVDFLTEADFVELFDQPSATGNEVDDTALAYAQLYDAFGLAVDYDVTQGEAAVSEVTTLAFYAIETDRVYMRGDQLTPAIEVVLAHELTHALQAQHFDLTFGGPDDLELRSIVEADALRVEDAFRATLSPADLAAADAANTLAPDERADLGDVPWAVVEERYAPYALGPTLVNEVFASKGNTGVNELLRDPPSEEVLINPWLFTTQQQDASVTVEAPAGSTVLDEPQPLSELDMLVMLDAWLPWTETRAALDGWAGGGYTSYQRDGVVCFTATASFDESGDPFAEAITAWAAAAGSTAAPTVIVNDVTFEACARGAGAGAPPTPVITPLQSLAVEHELVALAGPDASAADIAKYQCLAGTMIDDPLLAPLLDADTLTPDEQAVFTWQSTIAANACGVPPISR